MSSDYHTVGRLGVIDNRLDKMTVQVAHLQAEIGEMRQKIEAMLEAIRRVSESVAADGTYTFREACRVLGVSETTARQYPETLPPPLPGGSPNRKRYSADAVQELAGARRAS